MQPADPIAEARENARRRLLDARTEQGHWQGELSSSALSTATALFALSRFHAARPPAREADALLGRCPDAIRSGVRWLLRTQNADGGWGDTVLSRSNISTTALCWAALSAAGDEAAGAVRGAEAWLTRAAGSVAPGPLSAAITARYGTDRTFSVPILTMCALAGRLGKGRDAWVHVPPLPFELAAFPREWFRWLRLPVVSYALPALIAIGQVGHHQRPSVNPLARGARELSRGRTLAVLQEIQPEGGGFLEATPLTSFVTMSLVGAGEAAHPVVLRGVEFLLRSAREDGSWPIDTNLATWVTTLAVNALGREVEAVLDVPERARLVRWLLGQQYREVHPYTRAAPGGWAWTDLPGGVPDADDTPGALLALAHLASGDRAAAEAAAAGVSWLLDLQNADGGIPTFCRGWGALPFDRSGADLTAHALLAWTAWKTRLPAEVAGRVAPAAERAVEYLRGVQRADGAWVPLWFGNEAAPDDENPLYGTARVLPALLAVEQTSEVRQMRDRALRWLTEAQNGDGGWGGDRGLPSSVEETALGVFAAARAATAMKDAAPASLARRGARWLAERTAGGTEFEPAPIGFYFARLWYFERLYPLVFTVAALEAADRLPE